MAWCGATVAAATENDEITEANPASGGVLFGGTKVTRAEIPPSDRLTSTDGANSGDDTSDDVDASPSSAGGDANPSDGGASPSDARGPSALPRAPGDWLRLPT